MSSGPGENPGGRKYLGSVRYKCAYEYRYEYDNLSDKVLWKVQLISGDFPQHSRKLIINAFICVFYFHTATVEDVAPSASCQYNSFAPHHMAAQSHPISCPSSDRSGYQYHTIAAPDGWKQIVDLQRQLPSSSFTGVQFSSVRFRLTAHVPFTFLCVFASLGFRFLFVNNNFLQYSSPSCRCICSISTPPSILWILAHTRCCNLFTLLNLFCNCLQARGKYRKYPNFETH